VKKKNKKTEETAKAASPDEKTKQTPDAADSDADTEEKTE